MLQDPEDGCTFWTFQEYVQTTGSFEWNTRACSFSFESCTGIVDEFTLLETDPGVAGQPNDWVTRNGTAGADHVVFFGVLGGTSPFPTPACSDMTIDLGNARVLGVSTADATGSATVTRHVPAIIAGATVSFQAVDVDPCEKSNVNTTTFE